MMCCKKCALNPLFQAETKTNMQLLFRCQKPFCGQNDPNEIHSAECLDCIQKERMSLCSQDLWVLYFLAKNDNFAIDTCCYTLDTLVFTGCSDLVCELFKTANYEIRKKLWFRMVSLHSKRIYLLDSLFERISLPPLEGTNLSATSGEYQGAIFDYERY